MINRYDYRSVYKLNSSLYEYILKEKNLKHIDYYSTPYFKYPTGEQMENIDYDEHVWTLGDRFYKLAQKYYGDVRDWWIIAKFNNKPTESHVSLGEVILIPKNIQQFLNTTKG